MPGPIAKLSRLGSSAKSPWAHFGFDSPLIVAQRAHFASGSNSRQSSSEGHPASATNRGSVINAHLAPNPRRGQSADPRSADNSTLSATNRRQLGLHACDHVCRSRQTRTIPAPSLRPDRPLSPAPMDL